MQTYYQSTSTPDPHSGSIVDLEDLRRKRALEAQQDSLAREFEAGLRFPGDREGERPAFQPVVLTTTPVQRRRARREQRAWRLDICASLAVILMTVIFALRVIL